MLAVVWAAHHPGRRVWPRRAAAWPVGRTGRAPPWL